MHHPVCMICRHYILVGMLLGVSALVLPASCNSGYSPPQVPPQPPGHSAMTEVSLNLGRSIHQAKCANCHSFQDPSKYSKAKLREDILPRMSRKAKLTDNEQDAVLAYLISVSNR